MKLMPMFFEVYKKFIFMLPPEKAHEVSLYIAEKIYGSYLKKFLRSKVNSDSENIMGINVANKLGLAAGFDKNGDYINFVTCLLYTSPSPRDRQKSRMPSSA